ncbi:MAG TPA: hypothetical protein DEP69_00900 [Acidimicrobiaceae bacterium]|nr:hypothetical protein [Acidimicrobiaceae bacterium]
MVPVCALGQVWRGGSRQASLSRALRKCVSAPLDEDDAKACGVLLGAAGTADLVDASVVHVAAQQRSSGPVDVMTTDKNDVARLLGAIGVSIGTIEV